MVGLLPGLVTYMQLFCKPGTFGCCYVLSILHGHILLGMGRMGLVDTCNKSAQLCFEHAALQGSIHNMQQSFVTVIFGVKGCSKET